MSDKHMVLTAVGPDRPGLVKEVSAVIHTAGGNLEDSRMAVLAGEFALIVLFSGSGEALERIQSMSRKLQQELGFSITFKPTRQRGEPELQRYRLEVSGGDQPGIVHQISEVLAGQRVNVYCLESRLQHAAFSGTPLFLLQAELELPAGSNLRGLQDELDRACEAMHLDFSLSPQSEDR
jgi:glycine cleavage system transcriptional repressor